MTIQYMLYIYSPDVPQDPNNDRTITNKGIAGSPSYSKVVEVVQNYSLYPNPNNGAIVLQQGFADNMPVNIIITNLVGQAVYQNSATFAGGTYKLQLPEILQSGMYLMQISDANNQRFNLNFVLE